MMSSSSNNSSRRKKHNNDSMSMDYFSEIGIADKPSKFRTKDSGSAVVRQSQNQKPSRRRGRNQFRAATRQPDPSVSSSTGSTSTPRSSMEDDLMRLRPERFGNHPQQQQQQKHPREVPTLEYLFLQPKPANANAKVQTEHIRKHRNTEVVLGNTPSSGCEKKSVPKHNRKPRSSPMSKLKMFNCFGGSSGKPRIGDNDDEARRQLAAIEEYYGEIIVPKDSHEYNCYDEDNYGEANSLAASMSVVTMGSKDCNNKNCNNDSSQSPNNNISRSSSSSPKEILEELQEEEESLNSGYERRSFIKLSVSEIEEKFEKRDIITPLEKKKESPKFDNNINSSRRQPQNRMQTRKIRPQQNKNRNPSQQQQSDQQQQQLLQQRISATTSVIQGVVTPPRGAVSTSWMKRQQVPRGYNNDEPSIAYHSVATGSTAAATTSSQTTTSVVNLASEKQKQTANLLPAKMKIGPRCHFCGGGHWIYNCPHMAESSEGRERRAGGHNNRHGDNNNNEDDDYYAADVSGSVTTGLNDSFTTTDTTSTTSSSVACGGNQSHPFQCQVCFRR
jgi:hypothetical protein